MPINIEMPKLSDTMTEGTLVSWKKKAGDTVEIGDIIAEIETDKATMEMEAFDEGTITELKVEEGTKAPVGATLAILLEEGEEPGEASSSDEAPKEPAKEEKPKEAESAPAASKPSASSTAQTNSDGSRLKVSPFARKIAASKDIDLTTIKGSGPGGRIVSADLENASSAAPKTDTATSSEPAAAAAPAAKAILPTVADEDTVTPLSGMRKIIAERLLTSKQTIPHFYLHVELDAAPMMQLRKQVNAQAEKTHGNKYSVNDFVVKAMINACQVVPAVNASFTGDGIVQFANVGVSVAIAVEDGLVTPVVKKAQTKSLLEISKEIKEMAVRAREKKLKPNEFDGVTAIWLRTEP